MDHRPSLELRAETILAAQLHSGSSRRPAELPQGGVRAVQARGDLQGALRLTSPMKILFLHGRGSVPGGVKPTFLAQHGHEVVNPALPDEDFAGAVAIAQAEY